MGFWLPLLADETVSGCMHWKRLSEQSSGESRWRSSGSVKSLVEKRSRGLLSRAMTAVTRTTAVARTWLEDCPHFRQIRSRSRIDEPLCLSAFPPHQTCHGMLRSNDPKRPQFLYHQVRLQRTAAPRARDQGVTQLSRLILIRIELAQCQSTTFLLALPTGLHISTGTGTRIIPMLKLIGLPVMKKPLTLLLLPAVAKLWTRGQARFLLPTARRR